MAGRTFLEYQLALLRRHGVREAVLSICHLPERIRRHFGDGRRFGLKLRYVAERTPLGTAGAIKNAERLMSGREPVVVLNGDILTQVDLARMAALHQRRRAVVTIALHRVADPSAYGLVRQDSARRVLEFIEKPGAADCVDPWINAGVYLFAPEAFEHIPPNVACSVERQVFPGLLAAGERVWGFRTDAYWMDIGTTARYLQANLDILEGRMDRLPGGRAWKRRPGIQAGRGCRVHPTARLDAPLILGDRCVIGAGARVGEAVVLGDGVCIGAGAVIERSVLWDGVAVGDQAHVSGAVLADRCRIGRCVQLRPGAVLGEGAVLPDFSRM